MKKISSCVTPEIIEGNSRMNHAIEIVDKHIEQSETTEENGQISIAEKKSRGSDEKFMSIVEN